MEVTNKELFKVRGDGDDEEVFEINDYTNATDWENLVSLLEQIITDLNSPSSPPRPPKPMASIDTQSFSSNCFNSPTQSCLSEEIHLAGQDFQILFFQQNQTSKNNMNEEPKTISRRNNCTGPPNLLNDFSKMLENSGSYHDVTKWYGLTRFVIIRCTNCEIKVESDIQVLLSAVNVVCANLDITLPVLIQCLEKGRQFFVGSSVGTAEEMWKFEMVHLKSTSAAPSLSNLSGLVNMFKEYLDLSCSIEVFVSVCFTYALYDWTEFTLGQDVPLIEFNGDVALTVDKVFHVPVGTFDDPVSEIQLCTSWHLLSCSVVEESETYSDLTPLNAPSWWVTVKMNQSPNCIMSQHVLNIIRLLNLENYHTLIPSQKSSADNLHSADSDITNPTSIFAMPDVNKLINSSLTTRNHAIYAAEMTESLAWQIVNQLFDNAYSQSHYAMDIAGKNFKSAPKNSLIYNLSWILSSVYFNCATSNAMLMVWKKFVDKIRQLFDAGFYIPSISVENPDFSSCLLNQKLQLLNCCTKRRLDREIRCNQMSSQSLSREDAIKTGKANDGTGDRIDIGDGHKSQLVGDWATSSDEQFFDCDDNDYSNESQELGNMGSNWDWDDSDLNVAPDDNQVESKGESNVDCNRTRPEQLTETGADSGEKMMDDDNPLDEFSNSEDIGWEDAELDWHENENETGLNINFSYDEETLKPKKKVILRPPEGRLKVFKEGVTLLNVPTECIYIPITQDVPLMTEDMIEMQAHFLEQLGSDSNATELRMLVQSRTLLSDMESFKAANPGCVIEDFIQWYSPRDYDEIDGLSTRMLQPDNIWTRNWSLALPVPASRQKRLFDDTKEAENIFTLFYSLDKQQLSEMIINPLLNHCYDRMLSVDLNYKCFDALKQQLRATCQNFVKDNWEQSLSTLMCHFMTMEIVISREASLKTKFCHLNTNNSSLSNSTNVDSSEQDDVSDGSKIYQDFVTSLMESSTVPVIGASRGPVGDVICHLFSLANRIQEQDDYSFERAKKGPITDTTFPAPIKKEYIFTTNITSSGVIGSSKSSSKDLLSSDVDKSGNDFNSNSLAQRMYALIDESEFRVAFTTCKSTKIM